MNNLDTRMSALENHFDIAFAAPNGIKKLRELILTLAMQGKLVPQDPNDQPASELLKEIEAEKRRLVKEGKIREPKPLPEIKQEEVPYELPSGWEWVRNNFLFTLKKGKVPHDLQENEGTTPYLDIEALDKGNIRRYTNDLKTPQATEKDILVVCDGSRSGLVLDGKNGAVGSTLSVIETPLFIQPFVKLIFKSGFERLNSTMKGAAIPHLDTKNLLLETIGLPPLEEQHRIVAKIDQLMARCDELEKLRAEREQKRLTVHISALNSLLEAQEPDSFAAVWHFINRHFGELYSVKANVTELRKAILQLGIMGKLVPQDPNDQPASALLKEIEAEKRRMVKEKKIKDKPISKIKQEELPYGLPESWEWVRLSSLALLIDYGTSKKTIDDSTKVPVYRMGNIFNGQLIHSGLKYVDQNIDDLPRLYLHKNDILFNRTNSYELVGKTAIYLGENDLRTFASYLIRVRLAETHLLPLFFNRVMNSPYYRKTQIELEIVQQCGQANFNGTKLATTLVPLPPLAEQHRIVAKIDQLMALCDQLDMLIDESTCKQKTLLDVLMAVA
ncbi:MAG: restriction endonuclease subunit S [Chlorobium sp.]